MLVVFNIKKNKKLDAIADMNNYEASAEEYINNDNIEKANEDYKNAFDIALSTDGSNLPVTFKFNKSGKTNYYTFDSVEELKDFYLAVNKHITSCLKAGWNAKDRLDINDYK